MHYALVFEQMFSYFFFFQCVYWDQRQAPSPLKIEVQKSRLWICTQINIYMKRNIKVRKSWRCIFFFFSFQVVVGPVSSNSRKTSRSSLNSPSSPGLGLAR